MQLKRVSSASRSFPSMLPALSARRALAALGASLLLSSAWADVAHPLASASVTPMLTGALPAWGSLPNSLVRVVYVREPGDGIRTSQAARVYVDGRFHTALSAGNYTVFCLPAGLHTLASLDDPSASYNRSANLTPSQLLLGGNTYEVRSGEPLLTENVYGRPVERIQAAARQPGRYSMNQSRLLSRANTVACPVQQALAQP